MARLPARRGQSHPREEDDDSGQGRQHPEHVVEFHARIVAQVTVQGILRVRLHGRTGGSVA